MREYEVLSHEKLSEIQMWLNQKRHHVTDLIIETGFYCVGIPGSSFYQHNILISYIKNT